YDYDQWKLQNWKDEPTIHPSEHFLGSSTFEIQSETTREETLQGNIHDFSGLRKTIEALALRIDQALEACSSQLQLNLETQCEESDPHSLLKCSEILSEELDSIN
ncbi:hypothetical protein PJI17_31510, partial [Mycobacterium kansasii]